MTRVLLVGVVALASCGPGKPPPPAQRPDAVDAAPAARPVQPVLLVTGGNHLLEAALLTHDLIDVTTLEPAEYERDPHAADKMAVVIFDNYTPAALPPGPRGFLFVHPTGPNSPVAIGREVRDPRITSADEAHPVMRALDAAKLGEAKFERSSVFAPDASRGESALASSGADAIIVARRDGRRKIVALGFRVTDAGDNDFPLRVAFPLLLINALDWFAAD